MKKLLLLLTTFSTLAVAAPSVPNGGQFNNQQITCGGQTISSSDTLQQLSKQCKDFKANKNHAVLYDEHSGKTVICQTSNDKVETNTCQVKQ